MTDSILADARNSFEASLTHLHEEYAGLRVGQANPAMVENLQVDQYGEMSVIKNVASITVPEPTQLLISPWDKGMCGEIEKAVTNSPLGLVAQNDGSVIRINIPQITEDKRREVAKMAHQFSEDARVSVRNGREEARKNIDKVVADEGLSEDVARQSKDDLQDAVNDYNKKIDESYKAKEAEIMSM